MTVWKEEERVNVEGERGGSRQYQPSKDRGTWLVRQMLWSRVGEISVGDVKIGTLVRRSSCWQREAKCLRGCMSQWHHLHPLWRYFWPLLSLRSVQSICGSGGSNRYNWGLSQREDTLRRSVSFRDTHTMVTRTTVQAVVYYCSTVVVNMVDGWSADDYEHNWGVFVNEHRHEERRGMAIAIASFLAFGLDYWIWFLIKSCLSASVILMW